MEDTGKYLIHATFGADGIVERSDVVGAVFGQTEGLLGDELDIRDLQESAKLGRIDVEVQSQGGQSRGTITIASSLDRVETATLAAALETIERIGPCHASVEIERIEDVRAAKRRAVIDRATELLNTAFDEAVMDSEAILQEVRERIRVADITEYEGLPAGPNVVSSDAVILVEGRSDVLTLLRYGIKNAIAVEGTDVPDLIGELTEEKTVTAFLDGDRGGELILRELEQIGEVDFVAHPPDGKSVEDLSRAEVDRALRNKIPVSSFEGDGPEEIPPEGADTSEDVDEGVPATVDEPVTNVDSGRGVTLATESRETTSAEDVGSIATTEHDRAAESDRDESTPGSEDAGDEAETAPSPVGLAGHVGELDGTGRARFLDDDRQQTRELGVKEAFDALQGETPVPWAVVIDDPVTQPLLDVCAQRGIDLIVGTGRGEFVKQPASVRVRTFEEFGESESEDGRSTGDGS
ncbi:MAG: DNA primase DnaG, partial [Halodesulfurarchaeum sp.]